MTPFRRLLLCLFSVARAVLRIRADRNPDDDAQRRDHRRPRPDPAEKMTGTVTVVTQRRDGAPAAPHRRRGAAHGARHLGAAIGRSRQQTSVFVRGSNANHVVVLIDGINCQRSLDAERGDRLRASPHRQPRPYRGRAWPDEHALRLERDRRRDQHGHQGGFRSADDRRRLYRNRHAPATSAAPMFAAATAGSTTISVATGRSCPTTRRCRPRFTPQGGYVDLDGYRNINSAARLGFDINDNTQFNWFGRFIDSQAQLRPDGPGRSQRQRIHVSSSSIARRVRRQLLQWPLEARVGVNYSTIYRGTTSTTRARTGTLSPSTPNSLSTAGRLTADWKNLVTITDLFNFVGGVDYNRQWAYTNTEVDLVPRSIPWRLGRRLADRPLRPAPQLSLSAA